MGGIGLVSGLGGFSLPSFFGAAVSLSSPSCSVLFPVFVTELFPVTGLPSSPLQLSILPDVSLDDGWLVVVRLALPPVRLVGALVAAFLLCKSSHQSGYPTSLKHPSLVCHEPPQ